MDSNPGEQVVPVLKEIQAIMYKTEDGFEIPSDSVEDNSYAAQVY